MAQVTCPVCGMPGEAGSFCEMGCGQLPEAEIPEAEQSTPEKPAPEPAPAPARDVPALDVPPPLPDLPPLSDLPPLPELPSLGKVKDFDVPGFGFGGIPKPGTSPVVEIFPGVPIGLAYVVPETMWRDENSVVAIRFKAAGDDFSDVALVLRNGGDVLGRQTFGRRPGTAERLFSFNVKPRCAGGRIELSVDAVCQRDGADGTETYSASFPVSVKDEKPQTINVGDINIGMGGVVYKGLNFGNSPVEDHVKAATKTVAGSLKPLLVSSPRKLSLVSGDRVVQLFAVADGECLSFGRASDTTVPLRVYDRATRQLDKQRSRIVSGVHFRLQPYQGRKVRIFDGSEEKASTNGSLCCGTRISQDGSCSFGVGKHELVIGADPEFGKALGLGIEVHGTSTDISGFTVTRDDGADQTVLCVMRSIPFGTGGAKISWDGGVFVLIDGDGRERTLYPGMSVTVDGITYEVGVHRKYHL